jgi:hypothetical protein
MGFFATMRLKSRLRLHTVRVRGLQRRGVGDRNGATRGIPDVAGARRTFPRTRMMSAKADCVPL